MATNGSARRRLNERSSDLYTVIKPDNENTLTICKIPFWVHLRFNEFMDGESKISSLVALRIEQ